MHEPISAVAAPTTGSGEFIGSNGILLAKKDKEMNLLGHPYIDRTLNPHESALLPSRGLAFCVASFDATPSRFAHAADASRRSIQSASRMMQKANRASSTSESRPIARVKQVSGNAPPPSIRSYAKTGTFGARPPAAVTRRLERPRGTTDLTYCTRAKTAALRRRSQRPPEKHRAAHVKESGRIRPLDANGPAGRPRKLD